MITKRVFNAAFKASLPVLMGYLAMGMASGILLAKTVSIPCLPLWAFLTSAVNISGAFQFLLVDWVKNTTVLFQVVLLTISQQRCPRAPVASVLASTDGQQGLQEVSGGVTLAGSEGEQSEWNNTDDLKPRRTPSCSQPGCHPRHMKAPMSLLWLPVVLREDVQALSLASRPCVV